MAGPSPERFQRALTNFKRSLSTRSPELLNQFSFSSLQDLQTACHDIQSEMGQNGCLRRMRRVQGFIEAMEQLGQSIEVFVNANDLVCFIWGPIKFLLGIAKTHIESFDKLLDVYEKVGSVIPGLLAYRSMLEKHPPLATVLEDYYSDILRFHEAALKVFTRPTWKKFFKAAWKTFDTEFQPLLQSLANRRELLESEKGSASLYEISKARQEMAARHKAKKQELRQNEIDKHKWRLLQIKAHFEAADYQQDQEMAAEARHMTNTGDWVLQSPAFKHWADRAAARHGVLYVHGIPGAGKTTLISSIIANLLDENSNDDDSSPTLITYFYVKHNQPKKTTHNGFLRAIVEQIVSRDPVLSDHLFDKLASVEGTQLRSTTFLEPLIATALETYPRSFIVIDGLDEAASEEAAKSLRWLLSLVDGGIKAHRASVKILVSGRRDGILDSLLSEHPAIPLDSSPEHNMDILQYCQHMSAKIRRHLDISPTLEDEIISKVAGQANGMFLYARVVLDNLLGQIRLCDLKRELQPDTFPKEIDQAYERVAIRMLEEAPHAARQCASNILGWVTCAARPLHWREIQSIFCVDVESSTMDYEDRRLRVSCKQLCGSLVDVHHVLHGQLGPDDIVTIVHESAREYLVQKQWINSAVEHAKAATFCFRYLTSKPFRGNTEDVLLHVRQGYYGFQDYAVQHCLDHFESCTGLESHNDILQQAMESAREFLATYGLSIPEDLAVLSHGAIVELFSDLPKEKRERASTLTIGYRTLAIRTVIEQMRVQDLPPEDKAIISNIYGKQITYKCPKIWCDYFSTGFDKNEDRQKHADSHDRPYCCSEEGCFAFKFGYANKAQLEQHMMKYHGAVDDEIQFPKTTRLRSSDTLLEATGRNDLAAMVVFLESDSVNGSRWDRGRRPENRIPLCRAAKNGHVEACELLLERGAELSENPEASPLFHAIENNHPEVVRCLLSRSLFQSKTFSLSDCVNKACRCAQLDTVRILVGSSQFRMRGIEEWKQYATKWIRNACFQPFDEAEGVEIIKYLLEQGFSDCVPSDVLEYAKDNGRGHLASLLEPIIGLHASSSEERQQQQGHPLQMQQNHMMGASGGPQDEVQQRIALQTQQQISMLSTKLWQENMENWLQHQQLTRETCPPELLQKFKMQCLALARQKVMQLRQQQQHQQQQHQQQQQQALAYFEQQAESRAHEHGGGSVPATRDYQKQLMLLEEQKRVRRMGMAGQAAPTTDSPASSVVQGKEQTGLVTDDRRAGSKHGLLDYQMQLKDLEQQHKKTETISMQAKHPPIRSWHNQQTGTG